MPKKQKMDYEGFLRLVFSLVKTGDEDALINFVKAKRWDSPFAGTVALAASLIHAIPEQIICEHADIHEDAIAELKGLMSAALEVDEDNRRAVKAAKEDIERVREALGSIGIHSTPVSLEDMKDPMSIVEKIKKEAEMHEEAEVVPNAKGTNSIH